MGSKLSTVNERNAPVTYTRSVARRWPTPQPSTNNKEVTAGVNSESFHRNNYKSLSDDQTNEIEIKKPNAALLLNHSAPNTNRVISFHSSATWRKYFQASTLSNKLVVIFFSASWCGYCRYMDPILNDFAARYTDVEFDKIDAYELLDISQEFNVHAMPTFLFIKRGKQIDKVIGTMREDIQMKIEKYRA